MAKVAVDPVMRQLTVFAMLRAGDSILQQPALAEKFDKFVKPASNYEYHSKVHCYHCYYNYCIFCHYFNPKDFLIAVLLMLVTLSSNVSSLAV
jgi:hypothetical protein